MKQPLQSPSPMPQSQDCGPDIGEGFFFHGMETFVSICHKNKHRGALRNPDTDLWIRQLLFLYEKAVSYYQVALDCSLEDPGHMLSEPLPGVTEGQECAIILGLIKEGAKKLINGTWPFEQGTPVEWIWGRFAEYCIDCECETNDNDRWIKVLDSSIFDADDDYDPDPDSALEHFDVGDAFGLCQMFYAHAWTEKIIEYSKTNPGILAVECEALLQDALAEIAPPYPEENDIETAKLEKQFEQVRTKLSKEPRYLYLMKCESTGLYKIGISKNPQFREKTLQAEKPTITMVASWPNSAHLEKTWHAYFKSQRVRGEWFQLTKTQVKFICSTMKSDSAEILSKISTAA